MEELFNGQLSFADIDAEKFLHVRRAHADRRVNAMDRLTDDVINELIQLCLPHYHIKAGETVQQGKMCIRDRGETLSSTVTGNYGVARKEDLIEVAGCEFLRKQIC